MGERVFLRQKWTRYLGELRPIHDIYVDICCRAYMVSLSGVTTSLVSWYDCSGVKQTAYTTSLRNFIVFHSDRFGSITVENTNGYKLTNLGCLCSSDCNEITIAGINNELIVYSDCSGNLQTQNTPYTFCADGSHDLNQDVPISFGDTTGFTVTLEGCCPTPSPTPSITPSVTCQQEQIYLAGGGHFYSSTDGFTWTEDANLGSSGQCTSIAYNASTTFVRSRAFDTIATRPLEYSLDGLNWSPTSISGYTGYSYSVIWVGTRFVAAMEGTGLPPLLASSDGINWSYDYGNLSGLTSIGYGVAFNGLSGPNRRMVVLGLSGSTSIYCYSTDFINWNYTTGATSYVFGSLTVVGNRFYVGSTNGNYSYSDDGQNWTLVNVKSVGGNSATRTFATNGLTLLVGGRFKTGGTSNDQIYYSFDSGSTWNACVTPFSASTASVHDITFDGTKFIAVGVRPMDASYSYDGISWSLMPSFPNAPSGTLRSVLSFPSPRSVPPQYLCNIVPTRTPNFTPSPTSSPTNTPTPSVTQSPGFPTATPTVTQTQTPSQTQTNTPTNTSTPTQTQTNTPTPSVTPPPVTCYCYWLFNETGSPAGYSYTQCGGTFISDTLAGGAQIRICSEDLPAVDPGITSTPCGITCTVDADCTGCT